MRCNKCKNIINENEKFCSQCGAHIEKKKYIFIIISIMIVIIGIAIFFLKNNKQLQEEPITLSTMPYLLLSDYGVPKYIEDFTDIIVKEESDVYNVLESVKELYQFSDIQKEFDITTSTSENIHYYRLQQKLNNLEVIGQSLVLTTDNNGKVLSLSGEYIPNIEVKEKVISESEAKEVVLKDIGASSTIYSCEEVIYADKKIGEIAYSIIAYSDDEVKQYIVSAIDNEIIIDYELMDTVAYEYTGIGLNEEPQTITIEEYQELIPFKTRYRFVDLNRNIIITDGSDLGMDLGGIIISAIFSSTTPIVGDIEDGKFIYLIDNDGARKFVKTAITTMKTFEEIYDYYKDILGRDSYDNKGSKIIVNIEMKEKTFGKEAIANAAWMDLTKQMYIGSYNGISFSTAKDVLAHEFTHGVINSIANLGHNLKKEDKNKVNESGALNEAYADILGSLIEGNNWIIAEDANAYEYIGRDLTNPTKFESPAIKNDDYWYPNYYLKGRTLEEYLSANNLEKLYDYDNGGVHHNATVVGHAAYLMYNNGAFTDKEQMAKVWYNSLFMLTSTSNFEDCALAVIKTAKNLGLSQDSISIIEESFYETNMLTKNQFQLSGIVSNDKKNLSNVKVTVINTENEKVKYVTTTDSNGNYSLKKLPQGNYKIIFEKSNYTTETKTLNVKEDNKLNIILVNNNDNSISTNNDNACNDVDYECYTVTMYYLEVDEKGKMIEKSESYPIKAGTVLMDSNVFKQILGNYVEYDETSFYIKIDNFKMDISWYYRGTDEKYNWEKPVDKDIELEMKLDNGLWNNEAIKNMYELFQME